MPVHALYPITQKFLQRVAFETVPMSMGDDGPRSSFQGRSSSTSSFHASLLQATDGVMLLALCPQVLSTATCDGCFARQSACSVISLHSSMSRAAHPPVYLLSHFPSQQHVQGSTPASLPAQSFPFTAACPVQHTRRSFQRGMSTTDTFQPGLPVPLFITSSLNL